MEQEQAWHCIARIALRIGQDGAEGCIIIYPVFEPVSPASYFTKIGGGSINKETFLQYGASQSRRDILYAVKAEAEPI